MTDEVPPADSPDPMRPEPEIDHYRKGESEVVLVAALMESLARDVLDAVDVADVSCPSRQRAFLAARRLVEDGLPFAEPGPLADLLTTRHDPPDGFDSWHVWTAMHFDVFAGNWSWHAAQVAAAADARRLAARLDAAKRKLDEGAAPADALATLDSLAPVGPMSAKTRSDWSGRPPPRAWTFWRWIPKGRVSLLTGEGGAGKSLFGLQLCTAVAAACEDGAVDGPTGCARALPWTGPDEQFDQASGPVAARAEPGRVVYVGWEDEDDEVHRRLIWQRASRFETEAECDARLARLADRLEYVSMELLGPLWGAEEGKHESTTAGARRAGVQLVSRLTRMDPAPALVVIDPAAAAFASNENARALVRQFLTWVAGMIASGTGAAVVLVAHPPKSGSPFSGSTDWRNGVRSLLWLTRVQTSPAKGRKGSDGYEPAKDAWVLTRGKGNYAAPYATAYLTKRVVTDAEGRTTALHWTETTRTEAEEWCAAQPKPWTT